ncbi:MAG: DMT family transporter [Acidobacteriota bacterium]|nr:DMT family transporter [Acidobacteriota bacterium]
MLRIFIAIILATGSAALGQILLKRGMMEVGSLENYAPMALISYFWHALCNPYVILGTILNAIFYFAFLAVLSWTHVTVALPLTAIEYGFAAILAVLVLKERVPPVRWAGIALVVLGVIFIAKGGGED